jgi:chromosome segregation ATPase
MPKRETDAHRAVTESDLQIVDRAINDHATFQKDLFVLRRVLGEVGDLDARYAGMKQGIEAVQAEGARISSELEHAKAQLAEVQQQTIEKRKELADLTAEAQEKQRTLEAFTAQIDKIVGKAA